MFFAVCCLPLELRMAKCLVCVALKQVQKEDILEYKLTHYSDSGITELLVGSSQRRHCQISCHLGLSSVEQVTMFFLSIVESNARTDEKKAFSICRIIAHRQHLFRKTDPRHIAPPPLCNSATCFHESTLSVQAWIFPTSFGIKGALKIKFSLTRFYSFVHSWLWNKLSLIRFFSKWAIRSFLIMIFICIRL